MMHSIMQIAANAVAVFMGRNMTGPRSEIKTESRKGTAVAGTFARLPRLGTVNHPPPFPHLFASGYFL